MLGSRTLRFGDQGRDVAELHDFLGRQGYDLGEEQGYGYLTKDAVRQFQRDHGLCGDGVAGPRFFALLREDLPARRRIHVVKPGETLEQICEHYKLGPQGFGIDRPGRMVYPGRRLVFFDREIWGITTSTRPEEPSIGQLSGLVLPHKVKDSTRGLHGVVCSDLDDPGDRQAAHQLLISRKSRRTAAREFLQNQNQIWGFYLALSSIAPFDGIRYLKLVKQLRRQLTPPRLLWVELGAGIPARRIWSGVDYSALNGLVDRVVVSLPACSVPQKQLDDLICPFLSRVHSWKLLLRVPLYALESELNGAEGARPLRLTYQTARTRVFRRAARLTQDEQGGPYYTYRLKDKRYMLHLPAYRFMESVCRACNRHNLAGVILDRLGMEDPRIWQILANHFRPVRLTFSKE